MREVAPGKFRSGSFTYEYEHEISTALAILFFPFILLALVGFYVIIGIVMVGMFIFNIFKDLDFSGDPKN